MPLEDDLQEPPPFDLTEAALLILDLVDDEPLAVFRRMNPVSWLTVLLSGELSALWTTLLVFPEATSLKVHIELQDPSFE